MDPTSSESVDSQLIDHVASSGPKTAIDKFKVVPVRSALVSPTMGLGSAAAAATAAAECCQQALYGYIQRSPEAIRHLMCFKPQFRTLAAGRIVLSLAGHRRIGPTVVVRAPTPYVSKRLRWQDVLP